VADNLFGVNQALPNPSTYNMNGFPTALSYQAAADRRQTMAPFIQRAGQSDEASLQKALIDQQEYAGPEATQARSMKRQSETATDRQTVALEPLDTKLKLLQKQTDVDLMPLKSGLARQDIFNKVMKSKAEPSTLFMADVAATYPDIQKEKSPMKRMAMWNSTVKNFEAKYGPMDQYGLGEMKNYSEAPDFQQRLKAAHHTMVYTAQHQQDLDKERVRAEGQMAVANVGQAGQDRRQEQVLNAGKNMAQRVSKIDSLLSNPKTTDTQKESLTQEKDTLQRQLIEDQLDREIGKFDPLMASAMGPDYAATLTQARTNQRAALMMQRGMTFTMQDLRALSPGKSDDEIKAQAKKRNIKVSN
jgi:hypothetical protein